MSNKNIDSSYQLICNHCGTDIYETIDKKSKEKVYIK